ncbi:hypothetical protein DF185_03625 [Marinifilum breve]|uniref:TIR domain-containing protein n=1 Tax=Marinifilum breve TaxID=2184082 RepID=A0A2V4AGE8_9BACT|nr:toll/interleukin-1 receptor domain-containing protein [Marinifilum breve]PXY03184.1 hypothetical protein DF185_03625 [Marinifilum breve]
MKHDVLISYSSKDEKIANAICNKLEQNKIRAWVAPRDITPGKSYAAEINNAIKNTKCVVLIFNSHSFSSQWVRKEIERAVGYGKIIIPFLLENLELDDEWNLYISSAHWLDAMNKEIEVAIENLCYSVLKLTGRKLNHIINENKDADKESYSNRAKQKEIVYPKKEVVFSDNFIGTSNFITSSNDETHSLKIEDGKYWIQLKKDDQSYNAYTAIGIDTEKDFEIQTRITKISGTQEHGYGLEYGRIDNDNQYCFIITGNGHFKICKIRRGKIKETPGWTLSGAINKGDGASNILTIRKVGNNIIFLINNIEVYCLSPFKSFLGKNYRFFGNLIGFMLNDKQEVAVEYIEVAYLN